jgi:hypothetical protein
MYVISYRLGVSTDTEHDPSPVTGMQAVARLAGLLAQ